jgi:hypothetical protein
MIYEPSSRVINEYSNMASTSDVSTTADSPGSVVDNESTHHLLGSTPPGTLQHTEIDETAVDGVEALLEKSAEIRLAEKEAKDAILEAVKKMKALKKATVVDISQEISEMMEAIDEFPTPHSSAYSSASSSRSSSPVRPRERYHGPNDSNLPAVT